MFKKFLFFVLLNVIFFNLTSIAQTTTYTTEEKTCSGCGHVVSNSSRPGMTCPYCGVTWGSESTHTSTSYSKPKRTYYPDYSSSGNFSEEKSGYVTTTVNLREYASIYSSVLSVLSPLTSVIILGYTSGWYHVKVSFDGFYYSEGYIYSDYVSVL